MLTALVQMLGSSPAALWRDVQRLLLAGSVLWIWLESHPGIENSILTLLIVFEVFNLLRSIFSKPLKLNEL